MKAGFGPTTSTRRSSLAVRVEQERGAVQADRGLARARPALDHERRLGVAGDQVVLVGLDRGDDVAHARVAGAVELLEQEVVDRAGVGERAVERLVADAGQRAPLACGSGGAG